MGFRSAASDSVTDGASEQRHRVHVDRQLHTRHPMEGLQGAPDAVERRWKLFRENVRRFVAGERLLCVVDKAKGY